MFIYICVCVYSLGLTSDEPSECYYLLLIPLPQQPPPPSLNPLFVLSCSALLCSASSSEFRLSSLFLPSSIHPLSPCLFSSLNQSPVVTMVRTTHLKTKRKRKRSRNVVASPVDGYTIDPSWNGVELRQPGVFHSGPFLNPWFSSSPLHLSLHNL